MVDPREYVFTRTELNDRGLSDRRIARAIADGKLIRLRRGWFALPTAPRPLIAAVRAGGRVGCVSALRWHGVWTMPHSIHICVPRGSTPMASPYRVHWRLAAAVTPATLVEAPADAFDQFTRCGSATAVIVAADSALHRKMLTDVEVARILGRTRRGRRLLGRIDAASESGTETMVRLGLRAKRIPVRTQVKIVGAGRVDLLVGDRLVIEVDGEEWHNTESAFEADRKRDAALVALGFVVIRFSYRRVMDELDAALEQVATVVRRGDHRRGRSSVTPADTYHRTP